MGVAGLMIVWLLGALALLVASGIASLTGHDNVGVGFLLAGVLVLVAREIVGHILQRRPRAPLPKIPQDVAVGLPERRDRGEETAAIKQLRVSYPQLSLLEARDPVRKL